MRRIGAQKREECVVCRVRRVRSNMLLVVKETGAYVCSIRCGCDYHEQYKQMARRSAAYAQEIAAAISKAEVVAEAVEIKKMNAVPSGSDIVISWSADAGKILKY